MVPIFQSENRCTRCLDINLCQLQNFPLKNTFWQCLLCIWFVQQHSLMAGQALPTYRTVQKWFVWHETCTREHSYNQRQACTRHPKMVQGRFSRYLQKKGSAHTVEHMHTTIEHGHPKIKHACAHHRRAPTVGHVHQQNGPERVLNAPIEQVVALMLSFTNCHFAIKSEKNDIFARSPLCQCGGWAAVLVIERLSDSRFTLDTYLLITHTCTLPTSPINLTSSAYFCKTLETQLNCFYVHFCRYFRIL